MRIGLFESLRQVPRRLDLKRRWYRFSRSPLSIVGLVIAVGSVLLALLAPYVAPYPKHAGLFTNLKEDFQPPTLKYPFGTDALGRDVLSRTIFGFRYSLMMVAVVLSLVVPPGVVLGLIAGYYRGTWVDTVDADRWQTLIDNIC